MFSNDFKIKPKCFCTAETGELYSDLLAHYHMNADLDSDIGKVAVQRIPCGCTTCFDNLRTKRDTVN